MKKSYTLLVIIISLFFAANANAQTACSALWALTADQTVATTGNIVGFSESLVGGLTVYDYTGGTGLPNAQRMYLGGTSWPAETTFNPSRYVVFQVQPKAGYNLKITKISYYKATYGTRGHFHANLYWSYTSGFNTTTMIDTSGQADGGALPAGLPDARDPNVPLLTFNLNITLNDGMGAYFGFFPWYTPGGSSSKYFLLENVEIDGTTTPATGIQKLNNIPVAYSLDQNYPNPFNPSTNISFSLEKDGFTTLAIYNILGQKVATLISNELSAGQHVVNFDASKLTSGIYMYRLESGDFSSMRKMMLIK